MEEETMNTLEPEMDMFEPTEAVPAEAIQELKQKVLKTNTTKPKTTIRARDINALEPLAPKAMSDIEKNQYIEWLREERDGAYSYATECRVNAESAFEKLRMITAKYEALKTQARLRIDFIRQATKTLSDTVTIASQSFLQEEK